MRLSLAALCTFIAGSTVAVIITPSFAQIEGPPGLNKFCAMYDDGSTMDCTYATLAECQAAISGVGGICQANTLPPGQYMPRTLPQLIPTDPLGLYRNPADALPPVPAPPP